MCVYKGTCIHVMAPYLSILNLCYIYNTHQSTQYNKANLLNNIPRLHDTRVFVHFLSVVNISLLFPISFVNST